MKTSLIRIKQEVLSTEISATQYGFVSGLIASVIYYLAASNLLANDHNWVNLFSLYVFLYPLTAAVFARWERQLHFRRLAAVTLTAEIPSLFGAVYLFFENRIPEALIVLLLIPSIIQTGIAMPWVFRLILSRPLLKTRQPFLSFTIMLHDLTDQLLSKMDSLLIGGLVSLQTLGLYNRAYSLIHYPNQFFQAVINPILFPKSLMKKDSESFLLYWGKYLALAFSLASWFIATISISTQFWVEPLWGTRWVGLIKLIPPLSIIGTVLVGTRIADPLLLSLDKDRQRLNFRLLFLLVFALMFLLLTQHFGLVFTLYMLAGTTGGLGIFGLVYLQKRLLTEALILHRTVPAVLLSWTMCISLHQITNSTLFMGIYAGFTLIIFGLVFPYLWSLSRWIKQ